jgi:hypothetical protein
MKSKLCLLAGLAVLCATLPSCVPASAPSAVPVEDPWPGTPNPLDTPETAFVRPPSIGYFGPHSEFYPR